MNREQAAYMYFNSPQLIFPRRKKTWDHDAGIQNSYQLGPDGTEIKMWL